jgi:hypothetical protein
MSIFEYVTILGRFSQSSKLDFKLSSELVILSNTRVLLMLFVTWVSTTLVLKLLCRKYWSARSRPNLVLVYRYLVVLFFPWHRCLL